MNRWLSKFIITSIIFSLTTCVVILILAFTLVPQKFNDSIEKNFRLIDGNFQYKAFMSPFTLQYRIYFYNISNKHDIIDGTKPIVVETGPYIYRETLNKIEIHSDNRTITYEEFQQFQFDANASYPLTEQDSVTVFNFPLMLAFQKAETDGRANSLMDCLPEIVPIYDVPFIDIRVEQLLFDGFRFCEILQNTTNCSIIAEYCTNLEISRYVRKSDDNSQEFSYIKYRTFDNYTLTINRGIDDKSALGEINTWNGQDHSKFWNNATTCSDIKGTDSTIFRPEIDINDDLNIFSTDIGRSFTINHAGNTNYKDIVGEIFQMQPESFYSPSDNPEEDCFCTKLTPDPNNQKQCYLNGIIDVQSRTDAPVLISFPHFLWADNVYQSAIEGLHPQENLHATYFIIEPNTGMTLEGVQRLQINTILRPIDGIEDFAKLPRIVLPILWTEEAWSMSDEATDNLKTYYFYKIYQRDATQWGLVAFAIFIAVLFILILKYKQSTTVQSIDEIKEKC